MITTSALGAKQEQGLAAGTQAWPVPVHNVLHLQLVAAARPQGVSLLDVLGKTVLTQEAAGTELTLNVASLPRGVYLLRVAYANGTTTRRVVLD